MAESPREGEAATRDRRPAGDEIPNIYRRRGLRGRQVAAIVTILLLILLLALDGIYVVVQLGGDLRNAAAHLDAGQQALTDGDLILAENEFAQAEAISDDARGLTGHPSLLIASLFPYIRDDALAARALPEVASLTSRAGLTAVEAGETLGGTTGTALARAFYRDGRVQLDTLQEAEPYIKEANDLLVQALDNLDDLSSPSVDSLEDGVERATERLITAVDLTDTGSTLLGTMPALLGAEGPARYLLVFQSNSESRGTGGLIGLYGVLEANDGRVVLTHVGPFEELTDSLTGSETAAIRSAPELRRFRQFRHGRLEVNLPADLPSIAPLLLDIYQDATGRDLAGVFATDPPALQSLLNATGPLPVPGVTAPLGPDNTVKKVLHDSYIRYASDPSQQNVALIALIKGFYDALGSGEIDGPTLVQSFTDAVGSQHIKVYSVNEELQKGLHALGASGSVTSAGGNVQLAYHNNLANNKVDYFLDRRIDTEVSFDVRGNASVRTVIEIRNGAPNSRNPMTTSLSDIALPGVNRMQLNLVMPATSEDIAMVVDGKDVPPNTDQEGGLPVASAQVEIPPGQTSTVVATYRLPEATDVLTGGDFRFALLPHATAYPDHFRLLLRPPPGFAITSNAGGERVGSGSLEDSGALDHPVVHEIQISPL